MNFLFHFLQNEKGLDRGRMLEIGWIGWIGWYDVRVAKIVVLAYALYIYVLYA